MPTKFTYEECYKTSFLKGRLEAKLEITERMLIDDMPVAQIQRCTKASIKQINAIKIKNKI